MATKKEPVTELGVDLAAVKAQIADMIAEAKAEAAKIVEEAKKSTAPGGMTAEEMAAHNAYMNEEVEIKLFRDTDKYKDPVFVGVNGETVAIERGVRVKVKRKFAEALDNSDKQDYETSLLIQRKSGEFDKAGL